MFFRRKSRTKEKILVLYGSQRGNSEQAAQDVCDQLSKHLPTAEAVCRTLDDFLQDPQWTQLVVIVVSSYGPGQAPVGAEQFRTLCDAWMESEQQPAVLEGLQFAICGLGDSAFKTYLENPTRINDALQRVGAKRLGPMGKADQRGKGDDAQQKVIQRWMEELWPLLAKTLAEEKALSAQKLEEMKQTTVDMYQKLGKT